MMHGTYNIKIKKLNTTSFHITKEPYRVNEIFTHLFMHLFILHLSFKCFSPLFKHPKSIFSHLKSKLYISHQAKVTGMICACPKSRGYLVTIWDKLAITTTLTKFFTYMMNQQVPLFFYFRILQHKLFQQWTLW
jgi:hypothetical protein